MATDVRFNNSTSVVTKADLVRACITQAKSGVMFGSDIPEKKEYVIAWAVDTLGMEKNLAKVYVNNNWDKA